MPKIDQNKIFYEGEIKAELDKINPSIIANSLSEIRKRFKNYENTNPDNLISDDIFTEIEKVHSVQKKISGFFLKDDASLILNMPNSENMGADNMYNLVAMGGRIDQKHQNAHLYTPEAALERAIERADIDQINTLYEAGIKKNITHEDVLKAFEASTSENTIFDIVKKDLDKIVEIEKGKVLTPEEIQRSEQLFLSLVKNLPQSKDPKPEEVLVFLIKKLDKTELAKLSTVDNGKSIGDKIFDWAVENNNERIIKNLIANEVICNKPAKLIKSALDQHTKADTDLIKRVRYNDHSSYSNDKVNTASRKAYDTSVMVHILVTNSDVKDFANTEIVDWAIKNKSLKTMERILEHDSKLISEAMNKTWPIKATTENKVFFDKVKAVTPDIYKVNSQGKTAVDTNPDFFTTKERIVNFGLKIVGGLREGVNKSRNEAVKVNISKVAQRTQTEPHKREQQQEKTLNHTRDRDTKIARPRSLENTANAQALAQVKNKQRGLSK